jgi:large subunit ribosomal protein L22
VISTAKAKYIRGSARKARLVIDQIRGQKVGQALQILQFSPRRAAKTIQECLKSAIANAEQKDSMIDIDELFVSRAFIDEGPTMKRIRPRAMGRAFRVLKRFHHVTIELSAADGN